MTTLNLGYLATFRLVVQRGSFSAAADVLGISQPAVSLQVRQLEQFLQARLIERTGRGVKATAAGLALLLHGERIELAVSEALQSVNDCQQTVSGTITLGTGATACIHLLPSLLQNLREQHPMLAVGVTTGNTLGITRAVEENRLDLGLVTLPASGRSLDIMPVLREEFVVISAESQGELNLEMLKTLPLIAFEAGSGTRDLIDSWFQQAGLQVTPVMQLGSIIPQMAVEHHRDAEGLRVGSLTPPLYRQLGIVRRQDKILSKGMAEIIRLLQQHAPL